MTQGAVAQVMIGGTIASGVFVSPTQFLTAGHVVHYVGELGNIILADGRQLLGMVTQIDGGRPGETVAEAAHDTALIHVFTPVVDWLRFATPLPAAAEKVGYPGGSHQQIDLPVTITPTTLVGVFLDSARQLAGASGSPLIVGGQIVGLAVGGISLDGTDYSVDVALIGYRPPADWITG